MNMKHLAALALAFVGTLAAGAAHAGGRPDVQWSVTIGSPHVGVLVGAPIYAPRAHAEPVYEPYLPAPRYYPQPVVVVPQQGVYRSGWQHGGRGGYRDADHDRIPDRYDRHFNPRGDRDHDGMNDRYDRYDRDDRNPHRR